MEKIKKGIKLTKAQQRVLLFLRDTKEKDWASTTTIDRVRLLREDDIVVLDSLIKLKLIYGPRNLPIVRISDKGLLALKEAKNG